MTATSDEARPGPAHGGKWPNGSGCPFTKPNSGSSKRGFAATMGSKTWQPIARRLSAFSPRQDRHRRHQALRFTDTSRRPADAPGENSSASPPAMPAGGGSNQAPPSRFPFGGHAKWLPAAQADFSFSRNVFSRMSSTALSRGRPAARLLAMMSARCATHRLWPLSSILSARDRRLLKDFTP